MTGAGIFFAGFALVSVIHLMSIFFGKETLRRISKIIIIPSLAAVYIAGAENALVLPLAALAFGWIGDTLLLNIKNKIFFKLGLASFLLGHLCYTALFFGLAEKTNSTTLLIYVPLAAAAGAAAFRFVRPDRDMKVPVIIYIIVIEIMCLCGLRLFVSRPGGAGIPVLAGCLCFMISDCMLGYFSFRTLSLLGAVLIMVFYILAQTGIVFGLMGF